MCDTVAKLLICTKLLACAVLASANGAAAQGQQPVRGATVCALDDAGAGTVHAILDGRTFVLSDGREVRLAAIEVPNAERDPEAQASKAALEAMLGSRAVALKRHGPEADRYGRLLAHAFVAGDERSAQQILLAAGHARVAAQVGDTACAARLLGVERAARAASLGLWSKPSYAPRRADDPAAVLAERGRFTLVEGKVVSVRESSGIVYVNFGRRWSEDFTATVLRRNVRIFTAAGLELRKLAGRTVRVRGFVEERGGPWIDITRPEQIEVAERD